MRTKMMRPALNALALLLLLAVLPASGQAQNNPPWYQTYLAGLDKVRAKDYRGAIALLKDAIAQHPEAAVSPRYTPYYYAGLCYDVLGEKANAAEYYAKEERQEAIRAFAEDYRTLQDNLEVIQASQEFKVVVIDKTKPGGKTADEGSIKIAGGAKSVAQPPVKPAAGDRPAASAGTATLSTVGDPKAALKQALLEYLRGNYGVAFRAAETVAAASGPERKTALFIAGASHYSLFLLSGETDEAAKAKARSSFLACQGYRPPEDWISPTILAYYRSVTSSQ